MSEGRAPGTAPVSVAGRWSAGVKVGGDAAGSFVVPKSMTNTDTARPFAADHRPRVGGRVASGWLRAGSEIVRITVDRDEGRRRRARNIKERLGRDGRRRADSSATSSIILGHKASGRSSSGLPRRPLDKYPTAINPGQCRPSRTRRTSNSAAIHRDRDPSRASRVRIGRVNWGSPPTRELLTHLMDENARFARPRSVPAR